MIHENRKYPRVVPEINVFAALGYGNTFAGKINDISIGGLSFEHIVSIDKKVNFANVIDIFVPETNFYLADVRCRKVYDMPVRRDNTFSAPFVLKRCGVTFERLGRRQVHELEDFLFHHVRGPVKSCRGEKKITVHPVQSDSMPSGWQEAYDPVLFCF